MVSLLSAFYLLCSGFVNGIGNAPKNLRLLHHIQLDSNIYLTGSAVWISDSNIIVTANGGLLATNPKGWLLAADTSDMLVSYQYRAKHENVLYSQYYPDLMQSIVIIESVQEGRKLQDTLAVIDSCLCFIENENGMVIVHGYQGAKYILWELTQTGFTEVFALPYRPSDLQILNKSTIMASFNNKIITIQKESGASVFYAGLPDEFIYGFILTPDNTFYLSLASGISELSKGLLIPCVPNVKGRMEWQEGKIIVLDQGNSSIAVLGE